MKASLSLARSVQALDYQTAWSPRNWVKSYILKSDCMKRESFQDFDLIGENWPSYMSWLQLGESFCYVFGQVMLGDGYQEMRE